MELAGDEHAADAVLDEIAIDLRPEVLPGSFEPMENEQAAVIGERAKSQFQIHIDN